MGALLRWMRAAFGKAHPKGTVSLSRTLLGGSLLGLLAACGPSGPAPGASVEVAVPGVSLGAPPFVAVDAGGVWLGWEEAGVGARLARFALDGTPVVAPTTVIPARDQTLGVRFTVRGGRVLASDYGTSGTRWTVVGLGGGRGLAAASPIHETPEAVWWSAGTPEGFVLYGLDGVLRTDALGGQTAFQSTGDRGASLEVLVVDDGVEWTVERDGAVRDLRRDGASVAVLDDVLGAELAVGRRRDQGHRSG